MAINLKKMPEEGDIVLAIVTGTTVHAAFVTIDGYENVEGLIHISEASKTWVKNLKTHFRPKQKIVCKVLEIKKRGFVHLSVRRVNDYDRRAKWDQIKRQKRVENFIEIIAKKTKKPFDEVHKMLLPFEKKYGEIYFAFEEAKKEGKSFFNSLKGINDELWELVDKSITLPVVEIAGTLNIISTAGNGIERIKTILKGTEENISYLSAPNYRLLVKAQDYKEAEKKINELLKVLNKRAKKTETISFSREKKK